MSIVVEKKLLTAEEFCDLVHRPENRDRWLELVQGEVIELPPPMKPHRYASANIGRILGNHTFEVGRFLVYGNDCGVILSRDPDTVRGPDVSVYDDSVEQFAEIHPKYGETVPLLAVEVLSPRDRIGKVTKKAQEYLDAGVKLLWLVDPQDQNVTVHRPGHRPVVLSLADTITGEEALPGFACLVSDFFRVPRQQPRP